MDLKDTEDKTYWDNEGYGYEGREYEDEEMDPEYGVLPRIFSDDAVGMTCEDVLHANSQVESWTKFYRDRILREPDKLADDKIIKMFGLAIADNLNNWCGKYELPLDCEKRIAEAVVYFMFALRGCCADFEINMASAYVFADYTMNVIMSADRWNDVLDTLHNLVLSGDIHDKIMEHMKTIISHH